MARPVSESLEYFPMDVSFYEDPKILLVEEEYGIEGGYVAARMLCFVYQQGYYLTWNDLMPVIYARKIGHGIASSRISEIISSMVKYGLLSKHMFEKYSILTSYGIQKRWLKIIRDAKRKADIEPKYSLFSRDNSSVSEFPPEETHVNSEETKGESEESTQSKVKESKEEYKESIKESPADGGTCETDSFSQKSKSEKRSVFKAPGVAEVADFMIQKYSCSDTAAKTFAEQFWAYYESNGWRVGKAKMASWQSAIVGTWKDTREKIFAKYPSSSTANPNSMPWTLNSKYKDLPIPDS